MLYSQPLQTILLSNAHLDLPDTKVESCSAHQHSLGIFLRGPSGCKEFTDGWWLHPSSIENSQVRLLIVFVAELPVVCNPHVETAHVEVNVLVCLVCIANTALGDNSYVRRVESWQLGRRVLGCLLGSFGNPFIRDVLATESVEFPESIACVNVNSDVVALERFAGEAMHPLEWAQIIFEIRGEMGSKI